MIEIVKLDNNNKIIGAVFVETQEDLSVYDTNYAVISETLGLPTYGYTYDSELKAFISPKPFPSYVLDEENFWWNPPVPHPNDGKDWYWDEKSLSWTEETI